MALTLLGNSVQKNNLAQTDPEVKKQLKTCPPLFNNLFQIEKRGFCARLGTLRKTVEISAYFLEESLQEILKEAEAYFME